RTRAETLEVRERQQIVRLLVKEILVGGDIITIRHSLPIPPSGSGPSGTMPPSSGMIGTPSKTGYLLRSRSHVAGNCQLSGDAAGRSKVDPRRSRCLRGPGRTR